MATNMSLSTISLKFPTFGETELALVGKRIFANETSSKKELLVFWNPKEDFPSMGIGHYVWLPIENKSVIQLKDRFYELLQFIQKKGIVLPKWLENNQKCPWKNRQEFEKEKNSKDLEEVSDFLFGNISLQAEYTLTNFLEELPKVIENFSEDSSAVALDYCNEMLMTPEGAFALIDYLHFKGSGLESQPQYEDQRWGLLQVLQRAIAQDWKNNSLKVFIAAAKATLENRVTHAPLAKREIEKNFIPGWNKRIERYA